MAAMKKPMNHSSLADFPDFGGAGKLIKMAYKASKEVKLNPKITNSKKQAQSFAAARIDAYTSTITKALKEKQKTFHDMKRRLRPFEGEMAELSQKALERSGGRSLKRVMDDFDLMRRAVVRAGKEASAAASKARELTGEARSLVSAAEDEASALTSGASAEARSVVASAKAEADAILREANSKADGINGEAGAALRTAKGALSAAKSEQGSIASRVASRRSHIIASRSSAGKVT